MKEDFPLPVVIVEGKTVGTRKARRPERDAESSLWFSALGSEYYREKKRATDRAFKKYKRLKEKFREEGWKLIEEFLKGKLKPGQLRFRLKKLFKNTYFKAYSLGMEASGVPFVKPEKTDLSWLDGARKHEYRYLNGFLRNLEKRTGKMDYRKRWEMYVNTLDFVYQAGKIEALPAQYVIDWIMTDAEHCESCLFLQRHSPYTKWTIPCVPRDGTTKCLSNCKCYLRVRPPKSQKEWLQAKRVDKNWMLKELKRIKEGR